MSRNALIERICSKIESDYQDPAHWLYVVRTMADYAGVPVSRYLPLGTPTLIQAVSAIVIAAENGCTKGATERLRDWIERK